MRITIVIDDADVTAATEAAQTISRAFVRTGVSGSVSSADDVRPVVSDIPLGADADVGAAPRFGVGGPPAPGSPSDSGDNGSMPATPSRPNMPNPPPRPVDDPADESVGAAPELGGGG